MSVDMDRYRGLDGSHALWETEFIRIVFQHGNPAEVGINGCRIEDVIDILQQKLLDHQGRDLACEENATALYHLEAAKEALITRRRRREEQGVLGTAKPHRSF